MSNALRHERTARLVYARSSETLDVMGPTIQLLTEPEQDDSSPCIMRGMIPPGGFVALHSHPDPETFVALSGEVEGLAQRAGDDVWIGIRAGDTFHVPGGVRHALRNRSHEAVVMIVIGTSKLGRFFREVGTPLAPGAPPVGHPSDAAARRFLETADRYGYWNATAEENAQVGLSLCHRRHHVLIPSRPARQRYSRRRARCE